MKKILLLSTIIFLAGTTSFAQDSKKHHKHHKHHKHMVTHHDKDSKHHDKDDKH